MCRPHGVSRLGKTVLERARDPPLRARHRRAARGEGGAALGRRNDGETIAHLVAPTRYGISLRQLRE